MELFISYEITFYTCKWIPDTQELLNFVSINYYVRERLPHMMLY